MLPEKDRTSALDAEDEVLSSDEFPEYEWAEYNLPPALLPGHSAAADDDDLAFVSISVDNRPDPADGSG